MTFTQRLLLIYALVLVVLLATHKANAQALPTAYGPGTYLSVGGGASAYQADYGKRVLGGTFAFADLHPTSRYGVELETRSLRYHTDEDVKETTYLIGPHIYGRNHGPIQPYAKFLVGAGHISFPFGYATGSYLALAPGAGLDLRINNRISVRVIDAEYQMWPQFTYGSLHPYGLSAGINIRVWRQSGYPVPYKHREP